MKLKYRFIRTGTVKIACDVPVALQFAGELCAYINSKYGVALKCGAELFNEGKIHWHGDSDAFDTFASVMPQLMQDREYLALSEKSRNLWVEGSLSDRLVALVE